MPEKRITIFPKQFGFFPYIFLIYLLFPIFSLTTETGLKQMIGFILMPVMNGLEVAEELVRQASRSKVIILTTFARPGYFERAVKIGVHGYLLKDGEIDELASAIRKCVTGKRIFSPELTFDVIREENPLTSREQEILRLAALGKSTKEITSELYLSSGTVRNYISEIIHKLNAKNRTEAASIAEKKGWI